MARRVAGLMGADHRAALGDHRRVGFYECILLADDSSHAQRMGERILREGYEVVTVSDGESGLSGARLQNIRE